MAIQSNKRTLSFNQLLMLSAAGIVIFAILFFFYVRAEKHIDYYNEQRIQLLLLADELRQSSDDLTRMVRTYVATGNTAYKQHYLDIIDIRNGNKRRPIFYHNVYWDLILPGDTLPNSDEGHAIALLQLIKQAGVTQFELNKLAEAKAKSDALTSREFSAMKLIETTSPLTDSIRLQALQMLHDRVYHQAKANIMRPIGEFQQMIQQRMQAEVNNAVELALQLRLAFILLGVMLLWSLWQTYRMMRVTLGASLNSLYTQIKRLGKGDFHSTISVDKGMEGSIVDWLSSMQRQLSRQEYEREHQKAIILKSETQLRTLYESSSDAIIILDAQQQVLVECNQAGLTMFGCTSKHEFCSKKLAELSPPLQPCGRESITLFNQYIMQTMESKRTFFEWTYNNIQTEQAFTADVSLNTMKLGDTQLIQATVRDITDRKHAESREKNQHKILELITNDNPLPVILEAIVQGVEQDNPSMLCSILLMDVEGKHLLNGAAPSLPDFYNEAVHGVEIGLGVGSCGTAAFTNKRVIVEDIQNHSYWKPFKELAAKAKLGSCWSEPIRSEQGNVLGAFAIYHHGIIRPMPADLELIAVSARLASIAIEKNKSKERLSLAASVFTTAREGIMITDATGRIIDVNKTFTHITGYSRKEALGKNPRMLKSDMQTPAFYIEMWKTLKDKKYWTGEVWNRHKSGKLYAEKLSISSALDASGHVANYVALFSDITKIKDYQSKLEHIASYDTLTNLPNRTLLADRISQAIAQCDRHNRSLAIAFLDLDGFKAINDTYGHNIGDELLVMMSQRMLEALRQGDTMARFGGDEFVAVFVDLAKAEDCQPVIERLLQAIAEHITIGELTLNVSASIGVSFYPQGNTNADADILIRHADQAMYTAKQAGKNRYHVFDKDKDNENKLQQEKVLDINAALDRQEFVLYYQPKVNMRTGKVVGVEALIRWQHPLRGLIQPMEFLPTVENHDLSLDIGEWVIDTALTQIRQWKSMGIYLPISVNISAYQIQQSNFPNKLSELLAAHPEVNAHHLELEILETSTLSNINKVTTIMQSCQKLGVKFSLDDFGTGYSSLTYLRHLPVHTIKIDQSFVRDMLTDANDLSIIEGVIGLSDSFKRSVIAEGVETVEHGLALLRIGCDLAQGYGISRPMPAKDIPKWVKNWEPDNSWKSRSITQTKLLTNHSNNLDDDIKLFSWDHRYEIGHQRIDSEHRIFLGLLSDFYEAKTKGELKNKLISILREIGKYADFHFTSEENIMAECNYPELAQHANLHKNLISQFEDFYNRFSRDEIESEEIFEFLFNWFVTHTSSEDQKLVGFIDRRNVSDQRSSLIP